MQMPLGEVFQKFGTNWGSFNDKWRDPQYARTFALERVNPTLKAVYGLELTVKKDSWRTISGQFVEADFSWRVNFPDMER